MGECVCVRSVTSSNISHTLAPLIPLNIIHFIFISYFLAANTHAFDTRVESKAASSEENLSKRLVSKRANEDGIKTTPKFFWLNISHFDLATVGEVFGKRYLCMCCPVHDTATIVHRNFGKRWSKCIRSKTERNAKAQLHFQFHLNRSYSNWIGTPMKISSLKVRILLLAQCFRSKITI